MKTRWLASVILATLGVVRVTWGDVPRSPATAPAPTPAPARQQPRITVDPRTLPPGFDLQRYMLVAEVKPGMKGYGLSVFLGTKIERFEVEVISILRNFSPKQDVVLIRATGANLEHTGSIAGMSGSPIFLTDERGKSRMIGAFAYGWPMMKDPLAGVQPIQYMLSIPLYERRTGDGSAPAVEAASAGRWQVLDAVNAARRRVSDVKPRTVALGVRGEMALTPLIMPLTIGGMDAHAVAQVSTLLEPGGFTALQAGGTGGGAPAAEARIEPGSVLAVPLLTGDADMTAVGTCTEVIGSKVYGFGHPFTGEGPVAMPMCGGRINGVIANLVTSFKLGSAGAPVGTLLADHATGVAGAMGDSPATAPMKMRIRYADGTLDRQYRYNAVVHPQFTPLLTSAAIFSSLSGARELPRHNTVNFSLRITFSDGHVVNLADTLTNVSPPQLFGEVAAPISAAADNPFARVLVRSVDGEFTVSEGARQAEILHAGVSRVEYRPGDTVKFYATLRPFRSVEVIQPLEFTLPADLPDGQYQLIVSDLPRFISDEHSASPFRFTASNLEQVFAALDELSALRSDAFYLRLARPTQGVAVGRTSLTKLPASQRQLLLSSGRSDVTSYSPAVTSRVPAKWVIEGAAEITLQVSNQLRPISVKPAAPTSSVPQFPAPIMAH